MATTESVCKFHQSGYCKFTTHCKKLHSNSICSNKQCDDKSCILRHPRICKYFFNFGRCKFGSSCAFLHKNGHESEIDELKKVIEKLEMEIKKVSNIEVRLLEMEKE